MRRGCRRSLARFDLGKQPFFRNTRTRCLGKGRPRSGPNYFPYLGTATVRYRPSTPQLQDIFLRILSENNGLPHRCSRSQVANALDLAFYSHLHGPKMKIFFQFLERRRPNLQGPAPCLLSPRNIFIQWNTFKVLS